MPVSDIGVYGKRASRVPDYGIWEVTLGAGCGVGIGSVCG